MTPELTTTTPAISTAPAPIVPPQVYTSSSSAAPMPSSTTASTSSSSGSWSSSLKKAVENPIPLIFGIGMTTLILYGIYYFRYGIQMNKVFVKSAENRLDEIDMKHAEIESYLNSIKQNQNQSNQSQNQSFIGYVNPNLWQSE